MPYIFITANKDYDPYEPKGTIVEQPYAPSQLFIGYSHRTLSSKGGDIFVCKRNNIAYVYERNLGIILSKDYTKATISRVYVYFNKYEKTTPLILLIIFGGKSFAGARYYPYSMINPLIELNMRISIYHLYTYDNSRGEGQLLQSLFDENDNLEKLLTYQIDRRESGNYNKGKISISSSKLKGENGTTVQEFCKYTHTPTENNALNNSCLVYNKRLLIASDKRTIDIIQNTKYNDVYAYFELSVDEPLLLELHFNSDETENKFYYHTRTNEGMLYWDEIKAGVNVLGIDFERGSNIRTQLTKNGNKKLLQLLKKLKTNLFKTLFVMIEKQSKYSLNDVTTSLTYSKNYRLINREITPSNKTNSMEGNFIKKSGFKVFEQDFTSILGNIQKDELAEVKFILPSSYNSNSHTEITLYDTNNTLTLYHKQGTKNKLYVYFYGSDSRPLLFCYDGFVYKPVSKDDYFTKWIRINSIKCPFQGAEDNLELLKYLSQSVGYLNDVKLEEISYSNSHKEPNKPSSEIITHEVHQFNGTFIKIQTTYENKSCYQVYIHTPNGTNGKGDGYRLGDIKYKNSTLTYDITKQLLRLSVYYNLYDSKHEFPLLLILEFNDKNKEYYKLIHEDSEHRTWAKFQGVEEESYLSKVKKLEEEMDELVKEINKLYSEIENLKARIQTSESKIQTLKEKSESNKGEESTTVNPKPAAQNGEQIETQEKTDEEKLKEEEENFKKLNQDKDNKTLAKSDKEKNLEEKKEALRVLLEQKAYWIMGSLGITFNKESPLFNPDMCKENNTGKGTIIGTLSTLTLIFGGIGGAIYKYPEVLIYNIPKILRWIQQII